MIVSGPIIYVAQIPNHWTSEIAMFYLVEKRGGSETGIVRTWQLAVRANALTIGLIPYVTCEMTKDNGKYRL